jgi:acetyl-CoA/propionyl-CoA carboxylase carboxyl transferase subunit
VVHVVTSSDEDAFANTRRLASLLGDQRTMDLDSITERDLAGLLPESPKRAYDVHPLVNGVLDGSGVELHPKWAPNIVTTLGRFGGRTVGVIANNPLRLGGCLDSASAEKAARFVRMCDAFGVPLVVLVDVPGYLPGVGQEWDGGAYIAMNSRALGATRVFAWPTAEVAVMGAVAAVRVLHRRKLAEVAEDVRPQLELELAAEHTRVAGGLDKAVQIGVVDEVVEPTATRRALAAAIAAAPQRRGQHGNIPL